MFNNSNFLQPSFGLFILRAFVGFRLIFGVWDNIISWDKMVDFSVFLNNYKFPFPVLAAIISVIVQFLGGLMLILGLKTRLITFLLVLNFTVALVFVHLRNNDTIEGMTPALAILFICLSLLFSGAGKWSVDFILQKKNYEEQSRKLPEK